MEDVTVDFICYSKYSRWGKYQILLTGIDFLNLKKKYQQHSGRGINISRIWTSKKKKKERVGGGRAITEVLFHFFLFMDQTVYEV